MPVWKGNPVSKLAKISEPSPFATAFQMQESPVQPYGDDDFGFGDVIDMVNPLHHIPIVSNIYQELTGDTIKAPTKIMGASLYGGPVGMLGGIVKAISQEHMGADLTENAMAFASNLKSDLTKTAPKAENRAQDAAFNALLDRLTQNS